MLYKAFLWLVIGLLLHDRGDQHLAIAAGVVCAIYAVMSIAETLS